MAEMKDVFDKAESKMKKAVGHLQEEYAAIRAGRANPADLVKETSKLAEEGKVAVRSIRRDAIEKLKDMKKKSEITEDDLKQAEKKTQDLTDKYIKNIDACAADKEKEILEI